MVKVITVEPIENYQLRILLSNGNRGIFDVSPYLDKGVFCELKEYAYFRSGKAAFGGIMWPRGQDLSAETIECEMRQEEVLQA